jgi:hypothetical protein
MINHSEMVYGPGDRETARAFFETMGFGVQEIEGFPWLIVSIDPQAERVRDNVLYAQESTPAQQNLEQVLGRLIASEPELADRLERYRSIRRAHPQYVFHFGASVATHEDWKQRVDRLIEANENHPLLKGRIDMDVREPGTPGALGPLSQAFIHTDIIQPGPLQMGGLLFDLQWAPDVTTDLSSMEFPDRMAMV